MIKKFLIITCLTSSVAFSGASAKSKTEKNTDDIYTIVENLNEQVRILQYELLSDYSLSDLGILVQIKRQLDNLERNVAIIKKKVAPYS